MGWLCSHPLFACVPVVACAGAGSMRMYADCRSVSGADDNVVPLLSRCDAMDVDVERNGGAAL